MVKTGRCIDTTSGRINARPGPDRILATPGGERLLSRADSPLHPMAEGAGGEANPHMSYTKYSSCSVVPA